MSTAASPANELTNQIIDFIFRNGGFAWRASSVGVFDRSRGLYRTAPKKGVSDILACVPPTGQLVAIEVKIGKDRLSEEQIGFLKNVMITGGNTFVAKDFDSFKEWWKKEYL